MADIAPFRGLIYNPEKIPKIADVVTPPYDVISEHEQNIYYNRHPYNVIRLDKSKSTPQDTAQNNCFTRAADHFKSWLDAGILIQDPEPAFYLTSVEFEFQNQKVIRYGLIAQVKLEEFSKGVILPHEKTFSKVKTERLELMKACHANFSPVFSIFSDKSKIFESLIPLTSDLCPCIDFADDAGHRHRMWRLADPQTAKKITEGFKSRKLFIADGHHRYETALNYKRWFYEQNPNTPSTHLCNYIMMYLCPMEDPGLIILPAHRLISDVPLSIRKNFLHTAEAYFELQHLKISSDMNALMDALRKSMNTKAGQHKIGVMIKDWPEAVILSLKPGVMHRLFENSIEAPLLDLDVTVLTRLIFMHLLNFTENMLDSEEKINFTSNAFEAVIFVRERKYDMAFILNPTTNDQVRRIAEHGLTMPRKSTYYYPKVITGLVMNTLKEYK